MTLRTLAPWLSMPSLLIGAALAGVIWGGTHLYKSALREHCREDFDLISPGRRCRENQVVKKEYEVFQDELAAWIEERKRAGEITHGAVYFRDLQNGPWFGIHEQERFSPASLLKVPLMIAVLKHAEGRPGFLAEEVGYNEEPGNFQNDVGAGNAIEPGKAYTVEDLTRRMIVYSDNISKELLKIHLQAAEPAHDRLLQTYTELGIFPESATLENSITVKEYASVFRALHGASYLSREMSQRALTYLSNTTFRDGIVAGTPPGIRIAHKFGVREMDDLKQLHDCGIVYERAPYLLCVMTRGRDFRDLQQFIRLVARMVHDEVASR